MPWAHCGLEFILDDEPCPTCGVDKVDWTVQVDKTRTFVVGRGAKRDPWLDVALRDAAGRPAAGRAYRVELADGRVVDGALDEHGRARIERPVAGECHVAFPGTSLRGGKRRVSPPLEPAARGAAPQPDAWEVAPEDPAGPIVLEQDLVRAGKGRLVVFELPPKGHKLDVTLVTSFASLGAAQAWLLRNPLEVLVDGERVASAAYAPRPDRIVVQLRLPTGEHDVLISSRTRRGAGGDVRAVLFARRLAITEAARA